MRGEPGQGGEQLEQGGGPAPLALLQSKQPRVYKSGARSASQRSCQALTHGSHTKYSQTQRLSYFALISKINFQRLFWDEIQLLRQRMAVARAGVSNGVSGKSA